MNDSDRLSLSRRDFLRASIGSTAGSLISLRSYGARISPVNPKQKVIVVTFGGGARDDETPSTDNNIFLICSTRLLRSAPRWPQLTTSRSNIQITTDW